jgi:hypothetical protein
MKQETRTILHWKLLLFSIVATIPTFANGASVCVLPSPEPLEDDLFFSQGVNPTDGTVTIQLVYEGQAWLGIGRSDDGKMVGGEAVIGRPEKPNSSSNPGKYLMSSEAFRGVDLMEAQTLMDATIEQNDTHTVLTYTKFLEETGELSISTTSPETWIWAIGSDNEYPTMHRRDGSFSFVVSPCGSQSSDGSSSGGSTVDVSSTESMYSKWVVHGIFMGIAWGVFVPLAIGASLVRRMLPGKTLWFQIHQALNLLAVLFTMIGMAVAIAAFQEENETHFVDSAHTKAGLAVIVLVMVQAIMGIFKPSAPAAAAAAAVIDKNNDLDDDDDSKQEDGNVNNITTDQECVDSEITKKSLKRQLWEYKHRTLGAILIGLAWFTSYTGCVEFEEKYFKDAIPLFLGVYCSVTGIVLVAALYVRFTR